MADTVKLNGQDLPRRLVDHILFRFFMIQTSECMMRLSLDQYKTSTLLDELLTENTKHITDTCLEHDVMINLEEIMEELVYQSPIKVVETKTTEVHTG